MAEYVISTDSTADLTKDYIQEHELVIQDLGFSFGDELYRGISEMNQQTFFSRMRGGEVAKTNATIPGDVRISFEEILKSGRDILNMAFSAGLSASYNVASMVAEGLLDD